MREVASGETATPRSSPIAAADIGRLDDREYRVAQLAAGLAEGRLHLTAYALPGRCATIPHKPLHGPGDCVLWRVLARPSSWHVA
jgi:hypothetical protein